MASVRSPRSRIFWSCAGLIIVYCGAFAAWNLIRPGSSTFFLIVNDLAQLVGQLLMVPVCLLGMGKLMGWGHSYRSATGRGVRRWVPILLGLSLLSESLGLCIYAYYELVLHQFAPFPSWADAGLLGAYPFLFVAILLLPRRSLAGVTRLRIVLDSLMIMTAVFTFSWYFILGPNLFQGGETTLGKFVATAYPWSDLFLIFCVLLLALRSNDGATRLAVRIVALALVLIIVTDSLYEYQILHGTFAVGSPLEIGWLAGYMLLGLAAQAVRLAWGEQEALAGKAYTAVEHAPEQHAGIPSLRRSLLPYAFVPAVGLLALGIQHIGASDDNLEVGVYVGGAVLIGLLLARQILSTRETIASARRVQQLHGALVTAHRELQEQNSALNRANTRLESLATTDPLTGLPNHRAFVAAIDQELKRSQRYARPCALLFLDLDHFKAINDGYGHPVGDAVLCEFADTAQSLLRDMDTLGRWGGEEFMVILPETETVGAQVIAERLRARVAAHAFRAGGGMRLTCSVGVASYPRDTEEREGLVTAADRAMYGAKKLGRNQVRAIGDPAILALETDQPGSREDAALVGTVEALTVLIEARDSYTGEHTARVSALATRLALAHGLDTSQAYMVGLAGRLHDVGKVAIPDAILQKPARLSEEEFALMQRHTVVGGDVVSRVPSLRAIAPLIRAHHERWDGTGYPDRLAGEQIPLGARLIAVVDAYEAMTTDRPYQRARPRAWALAELRRCAGEQFDPALVDELERVLVAEPLQAQLAGV